MKKRTLVHQDNIKQFMQESGRWGTPHNKRNFPPFAYDHNEFTTIYNGVELGIKQYPTGQIEWHFNTLESMLSLVNLLNAAKIFHTCDYKYLKILM